MLKRNRSLTVATPPAAAAAVPAVALAAIADAPAAAREPGIIASAGGRSAFVAQLLAGRMGLPQARRLRRAGAAEGADAYADRIDAKSEAATVGGRVLSLEA